MTLNSTIRFSQRLGVDPWHCVDVVVDVIVDVVVDVVVVAVDVL